MTSQSEQRARQPSVGAWADYAAIAAAMSLLWLTILGFVGLPRVLLAVAFTFFVPGRAVVINWPQLERWSPLGISMVVSLALLTLVATVAIWIHAWHPIGILQVEAGLSVALIVSAVARRSKGVRHAVGDRFGHRRSARQR